MHRMDYFMVALHNWQRFFYLLVLFYFFIQCGIAFDTLRVYDNATSLRFKCPIKVLFCSGRLSNISAVKTKM